MFFEGSVAEAIAASRRELRPLVVLLTGFDQGSRAVQDAVSEAAGEDWAAGSILLALEDDLANTDRSQFTDGKNFRAFCPVDALPSVVMVSPAGTTLAKVSGTCSPGELTSQLADAYTAFKQQQQQQLAVPPPPATAAPAAPPAQQAAGSAAAVAAAAAAAADPVARAVGIDSDLPDMAEGGMVPPAATPYRLQFKFTDASVMRADFTGASLLSEVFQAVDTFRLQAGRPLLAYVLVQAAPRRVLGAADEQQSLAEAGVAPRTSLQVIPHAAKGHRPPAPAPEGVPEFAEAAAEAAAAGAGASGAGVSGVPMEAQAGAPLVPTPPAATKAVAAAAAAKAAAAAAREAATAAVAACPPAPPPPPPDVQLAVRLSNGASLRRTFAAHAPLAAVRDWVDEERTDSGAYSLTQTYPKRTFYEDEMGRTLQELGFDARMALSVELLDPKSKAARRPQQAQQAHHGASQLAPGQAELSVRLSDGGSLQRVFPGGSRLGEVLDWVDAQRTDSGAYKLTQPHPKRTFYSGDLGSTLQELGLLGRVSLHLELLPARKTMAAQPAQPAAVQAQAKLPDMFELQFKLTNGEQLRGSFPPESALQEVCHYLDTHRTDGGAAYTLVYPYPRRRFEAADMPQPLLALGLQPRQLLLLEPVGGSVGGRNSGGWSLGGVLRTAASYLNPYAYLSGPAGTSREQQVQAQQEAVGASAAGRQGAADDALMSGGGGEQQRTARKRPLSSGAGPNIHTLSGGGEGDEEGDDNKYWNGNSTEFGGAPPGQP